MWFEFDDLAYRLSGVVHEIYFPVIATPQAHQKPTFFCQQHNFPMFQVIYLQDFGRQFRFDQKTILVVKGGSPYSFFKEPALLRKANRIEERSLPAPGRPSGAPCG